MPKGQWSSATSIPAKQLLEEEEVLSIADTGRVIRGSRTLVNNLMRSGELDSVLIGRRRMITVESIKRLLAADRAS